MPVSVEFFKNGERLLVSFDDQPGNCFSVRHVNRFPPFLLCFFGIPAETQTHVIILKTGYVSVIHDHTYLPRTLSWFPDFNFNLPLRWRDFYPLRIIEGKFCSEDVLSGECRKCYFDWLSFRYLIIDMT